MKTPLNNLNGAGLLPSMKYNPAKAYNVSLPTYRDYFNGGFNAAVDQINQCAVSLDEESIIGIILSCSPLMGSAEWNPLEEQYEVWLNEKTYKSIAKALCANPGKIIKIERIK